MTILLIAINVLVFVLYELPLIASGQFEQALRNVVLVPYDLTHNPNLEVLVDLLRSMFMHAGWPHLLGNMLYLWIFGDNVEDAVGHIPYLAFYLICGAAAAMAHVIVAPNSQVPTLGASGAIAGVLGAYLVLFPHNRVATLIPAGRTMVMREMSAIAVLGFWFVLQLLYGFLGLGAIEQGGVAYFAHIGGFVAGMVIAWVYAKTFGAKAPATIGRKPA